MSRWIGGALLVLLVSIGIHYLVWRQDRPVNVALIEQTKTSQRSNEGDILKERLELERKQKEELDQYKWIDKRKGHVQIPVGRAMDYYLESLP